MKQLTPKQQVIYDYLMQFSAENGYPPSVREIAAAVGLKSPSTVHFHLKALEEAGVINRSSGKTRAITAVQSQVPEEVRPVLNRVPVLGNVAAGAPILAEECVEDYLAFDTQGRSGEHFALRIRGDSMVEAGIMPNDYVVVLRQPVAQNGDIVIALLGEEATCKRFSRERGQIWLLPENKNYDPIDGTGCQILGKVVAVMRRYA
ncbi:MAG: transcriptional repressor LexA [Oscillospiraceae bacterium]|nr:transcriptional repressor LexA [Oscillospiraceae bacterium]